MKVNRQYESWSRTFNSENYLMTAIVVSFTLEFLLFSWDKGDFDLMVQLAQGH